MKTRITIVIAVAITLIGGTVGAQETQRPTTLPPIMGSSAPVKTPVTDANTTQTPKERLEFLMSGYHYFPSQADLAKVGTDAEVTALLRAMGDDSKARVSTRNRALDAMGYYSDPATIGYLTHVMKRNPDDAKDVDQRLMRSMKHHAIMSLAKALGESSVEVLEYGLEHSNHQIRMTTISAMGKHAGKQGKARLAKLKETETNPYVQKELRKYVGQ